MHRCGRNSQCGFLELDNGNRQTLILQRCFIYLACGRTTYHMRGRVCLLEGRDRFRNVNEFRSAENKNQSVWRVQCRERLDRPALPRCVAQGLELHCVTYEIL